MNFRFILLHMLLWAEFALIGIPIAHADEAPHLRQSIRANGMGGAFTAVANDEMVLFYNPAGLRSVTHNMYEVLSLRVSTNEDVVKIIQSIQDSSNLSAQEQESAILSEIGEAPGKKAYGEFDMATLSVTTSHWGYSIFGGAVLDLSIHNPTVPYFDVRTYSQVGGVLGYAQSFFDRQLDLGFSGKLVQRKGLNRSIRISDELITNAFGSDNNEDPQEMGKALLKDSSDIIRFTPDIGSTYHLEKWSNFHTKVSLVALNIGNLDFQKGGAVPMTLNTGIATESEWAGWDITLASDFVDLTGSLYEKRSLLRNLRFGAEAGLNKLFNGHHFFSARVGLNSGYPSYGVTLNCFGFKIDVAQWSEEIGEVAGDHEDKRYAIQGSLIF